MKVEFTDLPWHDANILGIFIDRQNPGEKDVVKFLMEWPEDKQLSLVEFHDCYSLAMNMNFGIVASESVLEAECFITSRELSILRNEWKVHNVDLTELKHFKITTNSTNSEINIFCIAFFNKIATVDLVNFFNHMA